MHLKGMNVTATTIGVVVTDAVLTKAQVHRLSILAHDGLARAILPAHLPLDGDTVFAAATSAKPVADMAALMELFHLATLVTARAVRSEEHTSELQSLMRISYAVFCLKKKN